MSLTVRLYNSLLVGYSMAESIQTKVKEMTKDRALLQSIHQLDSITGDLAEGFERDCCALKELLEVSVYVQPLI